MTVRVRILQALAANTFGQAITIGSQLLLTPLYFSSWGAAQYGDWLLLSTIPAYLVMADVGLGSAAANEMAMKAAAGDYKAAQRTFWGAIRVCHFVSFFCMLVSVLAALLVADVFVPTLQNISKSDTAIIVLLLGTGVCVNFYLGVIASGFRSAGQNARGILYSNAMRLVELLLAAVMLLLHANPLYLCASLLAMRCAGLLVLATLLKMAGDWIFSAGRQADRHLFARLIKPSLSFLAFPLGNAMALQGPVLIIGLLFGSTAVANFSTLRTLSRIPLQIANVFNASVWPEMSAAFGARNFALMRTLHQRSWLATLALGLIASTFTVVLGETVVRLWLGKAGVYNAPTLLTLTATASLAALWGISSIVMTAINAHSRMVVIYLLVNTCCLGLAFVLGNLLGMRWFLLPLALAEFLMVLVALPLALRESGDSIGSFLRSEYKNMRSALQLLRA